MAIETDRDTEELFRRCGELVGEPRSTEFLLRARRKALLRGRQWRRVVRQVRDTVSLVEECGFPSPELDAVVNDDWMRIVGIRDLLHFDFPDLLAVWLNYSLELDLSRREQRLVELARTMKLDRPDGG